MLENTFGNWTFQGDDFENMGGARTWRFAPVARFAELAPAVQGVVNTASTFSGDDEWIDLIPIEDTADLDEDGERKGGGPFYENQFKCQLAGETAAGRMMNDSMFRVPVIAEVTDNNGMVRRMGELADPAWITVKHGTGRGVTARTAWDILIEWNSERPLFVVDATFVPTAPPEDEDDSGSASASDVEPGGG